MDRIALLMVLAAFALLAFPIARSYWESSDRNGELITAYGKLRLGDTQDRVAQVAQQFPRLFVIKVKSDFWRVSTPSVIPAMNWELHLLFDPNGRICGMGIRTADSASQKPSGSPPDRVNPNHMAQWRPNFVDGTEDW